MRRLGYAIAIIAFGFGSVGCDNGRSAGMPDAASLELTPEQKKQRDDRVAKEEAEYKAMAKQATKKAK